MNFILSKNYGKNIFDDAHDEYKNYYESTNIWNEFLEKVPTLKFLIENNPLLYNYIHFSFLTKQALQPSIIGEYVVTSLYADYLKLKHFDKNEGRGHYFNDDLEIDLFYYGDPSRNDLIVKNKSQILKGEIKNYVARAGDCDLKAYDEKGHTEPRTNTIFDTPEGRALINIFNEENTNFKLVFDHTNFKIDKNKELCVKMGKQYFKNIDFCIIIYPTYISYFEVNEDFFKIINYAGSEIRSTGKNYKKIILKDLFKKWAKDNNIKIEKDIVYISTDAIIPIKGLGKPTITRFGLLNSNCFFVKKEDIIDIKDNVMQFSISKIKQCTPNGSIHVTFREV